MKLHKTYTYVIIVFISLLGSVSAQKNVSGPLHVQEQSAFNFIIIGDRTGAGPDSWKTLGRSISETNRISPDFVLFIGDLIDGYDMPGMAVDKQWEKFGTYADKLSIPYVCVPGNHDIYDDHSYAAWKKNRGETYFSFTYRGCGFIVLNTEETLDRFQGGLGSRQITFLKQKLAEFSGKKHLFILMHRPVWVSRGQLKREWQQIKPLLGSVPFTMIAGHMHALGQKTDSENNKYIIVGPTGGKTRLARNPALALFQHYTLFTVKPDSIHIAYIEPGRVYDQSLAESAYNRYKATLFMYQK